MRAFGGACASSTLRCALRSTTREKYSHFSTSPPEVSLDRLTQENLGVAVITLNRPGAKNALGRRMLAELNAALEAVRPDTSVRAVVIRSAVAGVFCAGADLRERAGMTQPEAEAFVTALRRTFSAIGELPPPTIACIEGAALGGGLEMALACDFRVAALGATLGLPETALGIIPGAGGSQRLPRLIGPERAKLLAFTAMRLRAGEAGSVAPGLLTAVSQHETDAYEETLLLARRVLSSAPLAVRAVKRAINEGGGLPMEAAMGVEREAYASILGSEDRVEGLAAFKEKRKPVYRGR